MPSPSTKSESKLPPVRIVGFTGHRQLRNPEAVGRVLGRELEAAKASGFEIIAVSSVASGADTVFAREVIRAGIKWVALLPLPKEMFREDFSADEWAQAEELLHRAAQVRILPGNERPQAYVDCGKATVDESDWLLAVWDGEPSRGAGGTAEIVAYARTLGRQVTCLRETPEGVVEVDPAQMPPIITETREILFRIGDPVDLPSPPKILLDRFKTCDEIATRTAPNFRRDNLIMLVLLLCTNLISGLILSLAAEQVQTGGPFVPAALSLLQIVFTGWALIIFYKLKRRHVHDLWVTDRLQAEYCRSVLATWHCDEPTEPVFIHAVPMLRELSQTVLLLRLEKPRHAPVTMHQFRAAYAHYRVLDQMEYFREEAGKAVAAARPLRRRYWIYTGIAWSSSMVAFAHYSLAAANRHPISHHVPAWFGTTLHIVIDLMPLAFPALASFALTRMAIEDLDRRAGRFQDLQKAMRLALIELSFCGSWASLRRTVERTEKILLNEVLEWYTVTRYAKIE